MSMIRKYHNHAPHTNPWHYEEESHNINSNKTCVRQETRSIIQLSLPLQDDCKTRRDTKRQINNNRTTTLERTAA